MAHQWRGVIREYADRLPVTEATRVITLGEGGTPLVHAQKLSELTGSHRLPQGGGHEPDRLLQGPRHDHGHDGRRRSRRQGGGVRLHRQHLGLRRGLRHGRRADSAPCWCPRARSPWASSARRSRTAPRCCRWTATSTTAWTSPASWASPTRCSWSTRSTRPGSRARRPVPSKSSTRWATPRTSTCSRWATPATSARTGRATRSTAAPFESATAGTLAPVATKTPAMWGFQAAGAAPFVAGHPITEPDTIATAIRIGNPASWDAAVAARDESGGLIEAVTDEEILAAHRWLSAREGVFVEPGSAAGVAGLLKKHAAGEVPAGKTIVITVTGHGLKDPQWALRTEDGSDVAARQGVQRRRDRRRSTGTGRKITVGNHLTVTADSRRLPAVHARPAGDRPGSGHQRQPRPRLRQPGTGPVAVRHPHRGDPGQRRAGRSSSAVRARIPARGTPATWWSGP